MNTRRLRYLVAVADFGSFTRAAEYLHIEQPPLTQQIQVLERELGVTLFVRSRQGAVPTEIGATLVEKARALLELEQSIMATASSFARGEKGQLRIGMAGGISLLSLVPRAIEEFRHQWPDIGVTLEESYTTALCHALHSKQLDVAVVRGPFVDPSINLRHLVDEPAVIVLPKDHAQHDSSHLGLHQLADSPWIIFARALGPGFYDAIIDACRAAGFTPRLGPCAPQLSSVIPLVAAGLGVGIVPAYLDRIQTNGVSFHAIKGPAPQSSILLASHKSQKSQIVQRFEDILLTLSRQVHLLAPATQTIQDPQAFPVYIPILPTIQPS